MAEPTELGVDFTDVEIDDMKAGAQVSIDTVNSKKVLNLSNEEREELSKVGDKRAPYVLKSVGQYAVDYPDLNGKAYPLSKAALDLDTYGQLHEVETKLRESLEKVVEMKMVAGHFLYKFMRDQYDNAVRYRGDNVPGAQVVYDGLKGAFEGQGPQGDDDEPTPTEP